MSEPCAVEGCDSPRQAKRLCWLHYGRLRRNGDPIARGQHGGRRDQHVGPVENIPDPAPVRALRRQLEHDRAHDRSFGWAWSYALEAALGTLPRQLQQEWRDVLTDHRSVWKAAYFGMDVAELEPMATLRLEDPEPWHRHRRTGPPVVTTGARHDGDSELEPLDVAWCR